MHEEAANYNLYDFVLSYTYTFIYFLLILLIDSSQTSK